MDLTKLVIASANSHKIAEIKTIFSSQALYHIRMVGIQDYNIAALPPETGLSFKENAFFKAKFICEKTGIPALADDSGLCIDLLNGMPGILSARWSGKHDDKENMDLVLKQIKDFSADKLTAAFISWCVLVFPNGTLLQAEGRWEGRITKTPKGISGFGYDPIFIPNNYVSKSVAELTEVEKNKFSHRYKALYSLIKQIKTSDKVV